MIGLPHSSHQTLGRAVRGGSAADFVDLALHGGNHFFAPSRRPDRACNGCDVGIDIRQCFGSEPKKARARLQNFADRLFLIGNSRNHQIGLRGDDLGACRQSMSRPG